MTLAGVERPEGDVLQYLPTRDLRAWGDLEGRWSCRLVPGRSQAVREECERLLAEEPEDKRAELGREPTDGGRTNRGRAALINAARERVGVTPRVAKRDAQVERIVRKYPELERWAQRCGHSERARAAPG